MISLKRNSKGKFVEATGKRTRASSYYNRNQTESFKISRSKFSDFLSCKRCFYLDRVLGLVSPDLPGWTLNETTDLLLKKEFDLCREREVPHRIFSKFNLDHIIPFQHEDIEKWRDSLHHGIEAEIDGSNIILYGGIDDVGIDLKENKLVIIDYKSQATKYPVNSRTYLSNTYHQSYKLQMDVYAFILSKMGFDVSGTSYFYVCNADRSFPDFQGLMRFEETLIPYEPDTKWIEPQILSMVDCLNSPEIPEANAACMNCAYSRARIEMEV